MKTARALLVVLALVGCGPVDLDPSPDVAPGDAGTPPGDGAWTGTDGGEPDAWTSTDGSEPDARTGTDGSEPDVDAGPDAGLPDASDPDAALEPDAAIDPELSAAEACTRVRDAWTATSCNPDFYWCGYTAPALTSDVDACADSIAVGYSEASGPADREARCRRALAAMYGCGS